MFEEVWEKLSRYDSIIIHRHTHPDGDALGSQIGLAALLRVNCPGKTVLTVGDSAGRLAFMGGTCDAADDAAYADSLAVILDSGSPHLVSDDRYRLAKETVRIDHHVFCGQFADTEVIDPSFESCCGMIAYMAMEQKLRLDETAAKALFTGMVTDSGRFRYDAVSSRTFQIAAFLTSVPFSTEEIYAQLYAEDIESVRRKARYTEEISVTEHGAAWVYFDAEKVSAMGVSPYALSRGYVNTMADIRDVPVWVNFTESPEGVLCELRSAGPDIQPIAVKYGGGGHKKASGACVKDRETAMRMLFDMDAAAEAYLKNER